MTTKNSPLETLKQQADTISRQLKRMDRGEVAVADPAGKIAAAREKGEITFAVVMDDKMLKITMPFDVIRSSTEAGISEWIVAHMQERKETQQ